MLRDGGLEVVSDNKRKADIDNPKGYFEYEPVKDIHRSGQNLKWLKKIRGKGIKIISFLLRYLPDNNNYNIIFMQRDLNEILVSQAKMLHRRGEEHSIPDEKMMVFWKEHLEQIFFIMHHRPSFRFIVLDYLDVIQDPRSAAKKIESFLNIDLDIDKMAEAVSPELYRNRKENLIKSTKG